MTSYEKILVVGLGFGQLYVDLLRSKGYTVYTMDPDHEKHPNFLTANEAIQELDEWFLTIICTPNYFHGYYTKVFGPHCENILVEKPGFKDITEHVLLTNEFPNIHMTKNNYFRPQFVDLKSDAGKSNLINLVWCEKNRIPSPGSWFTNKKFSFGGVSRDLLPHLYHTLRLFVPDFNDKIFIEGRIIEQLHKLSKDLTTDYGTVDLNGVYDVDDFVWLDGTIGSKEFILNTSWKEKDYYGKSKDSRRHIELNNQIIPFDLCPVEAYDIMLDKLFFNPDEEVQKISKKMDMELMTLYEYL